MFFFVFVVFIKNLSSTKNLNDMIKNLLTCLLLAGATTAGAAGWPAGYGGVMLQGFSWDSYSQSQWSVLEAQAADMQGYFDLIWVPQSGKCYETTQVMGYTPYYYFNQNSSFGTETQLRSMIKALKEKGIGTIADVVVNHHNTDGWYTFPAETYNGTTYQFQSTDICSNDDNGATKTQAAKDGVTLSSNADTGEDWSGMRDLDHKSQNVQNIIKAYVKFLKDDIGYAGYRYDMVKGFGGEYVKMYNEAGAPDFSVGEYWDGNVTIVKNWIDKTEKNSAAFDFPFRYTVRDAVNQGNWTNLDNASLISDADYKQYSVTFVENHDTQDRTATGGDKNDPLNDAYILPANAYLLAMPGTPCVFQPHWLTYKKEIKSMIDVRKAAGITNTSVAKHVASQQKYHVVQVTGTNATLLCVVGSDISGYTMNYDGYTKVLEGTNYAYYLSSAAATAFASLPSGTYESEQKVKLTAVSATSGAKIVYTTDGTEPTANSTAVASGTEITISKSCTLRIALLVGATLSGAKSYTYSFETFQPKTIRVAVNVDAVNWSNVNFYSWDDIEKSNASAAWPGDKVTSTLTYDGKTYYYKDYTITSATDAVSFVFSTGTGSPQTIDCTGINTSTYFTVLSTQTQGKYNVSSEVATGIESVEATADAKSSAPEGWYTLTGVRLSAQPTARGVYIYNGKAVMVK